MKKTIITVLIVILTLGLLQYAKQNIIKKMVKSPNSAQFEENEMPNSK